MKILEKIKNSKPYVIAEAGLNHNGSIEIAKQLIDVAKEAGSDAVKFQKRDVNNLATADYLDKDDKRFPNFGKTYREIRNFLEFDYDQYFILKKYCEKKQIDFLVTAFDINSVDFLEKLNVQFYKLASHSLTNLELIEYISQTKKPCILSTGMAEYEDIDLAVNIFIKNKTPLILLHCVSSYPTEFEESNLSMIQALKEKYNLLTGYSGHENGYLPSILSIALGADVIERHFTLDKKMEGFDHKISLEPSELKQMINIIKKTPKAIGNGTKKLSDVEKITADKYHVSAISKNKILKNQILDIDMIEYKNPGTGIGPKDISKILGKKALIDIDADKILSIEMFLK